MIYPGDERYAFELHLDGTFSVTEIDGWKAELRDPAAFTLLRFTGLEDVHGRRIYERDIVRHLELGHAGIVEQFDYQWALTRADGYAELFIDYGGAEWDRDAWERVGNAFETPDLVN